MSCLQTPDGIILEIAAMMRSKFYSVASGIALAVPVVPAVAAVAPSGFWSLGKTMHGLDGMRLRVGARVVRLDAPSLLCSGLGRAVRDRGVRKWRRFQCTYVAFISGGTYDCEFRAFVVHGRLSLRDPRWIGAPP
jgi:hypothetical protein